MKVGIISDTHGLLRPEVTEALEGCEAILHAGDISSPQITDTLACIAPVYAVRGNNDFYWADQYPPFLNFELAGLRVYMTHMKRDLPANLSVFDLVVFGHSHKYEERRQGKTLLLNPGSCGPRRFNQAITMATAEITGGSIEVTRIDIPQQMAATLSRARTSDLKKQIETVMKETQKNKTPEAIAAKHGMDVALTEKIARLYLTHPGVTADGILAKMGY